MVLNHRNTLRMDVCASAFRTCATTRQSFNVLMVVCEHVGFKLSHCKGLSMVLAESDDIILLTNSSNTSRDRPAAAWLHFRCIVDKLDIHSDLITAAT